MKYSEAKKILEKNGMELDMESNAKFGYASCNGVPAVSFSKCTCYLIDTNWHNEYATVSQLAIAQKVAYKLSRTKPEDREDDPKKYYLRILNLPDINDGYVNLHKCDNHFTLNNKSDTNIFKTQFTDAEVKQMQQDPIFANIDLEKCKEPVED